MTLPFPIALSSALQNLKISSFATIVTVKSRSYVSIGSGKLGLDLKRSILRVLSLFDLFDSSLEKTHLYYIVLILPD